MSLHAFNSGCNAICFKKNNIKYAMCCAWAQMIDYDKITLLLGSQSVTGKNIEIGDIVGVSALSVGQKDIALKLGDGHSDEVDKLKNIDFYEDNNAILIKGASTNLICKVIDIIKKDYIKGDNFVVLEVIKAEENHKPFLPIA